MAKRGETCKYCDKKAVTDDGLCRKHSRRVKELDWETPEYKQIKECELNGCDEEFKQKEATIKYCEKHRQGGDRHYQTLRVVQGDWESINRDCKNPRCSEVVSKGREKYCSDECANKHKSQRQMNKKMEALVDKYPDVTWEVAKEFNTISVDLSYVKSRNEELFWNTIEEMIEEEGREFTKKALFRVPLTQTDANKLPFEPLRL